MKEKIMRGIGIILLLLCLLWFAAAVANAQATDTYVGACASQEQCVLVAGQSWVTGNQVWRFTAFQKSESIRIWIRNNNPTSAHTSQTVQVWITDEPNVSQLIGLTSHWTQAVVTDNSVAGAKCSNLNAQADASAPGANGKGTCYTVGMYAVQIAVRITGANAQAGSPDTFDMGVVQQPTTYPGGPQPGADSSTGGTTGIGCPGSALPTVTFITALANTTTQVVGISGLKRILVCSVVLSNTNATPTNVKFVEGTGVNCAQGQAQLTGNIGLGATPSTASLPGVNWQTVTGGDALCATGSAAGAVDITVTSVFF